MSLLSKAIDDHIKKTRLNTQSWDYFKNRRIRVWATVKIVRWSYQIPLEDFR